GLVAGPSGDARRAGLVALCPGGTCGMARSPGSGVQPVGATLVRRTQIAGGPSGTVGPVLGPGVVCLPERVDRVASPPGRPDPAGGPCRPLGAFSGSSRYSALPGVPSSALKYRWMGSPVARPTWSITCGG